MTAPTTEPAALDIPDGTAPVRLPVMVVEGMWTADGRFLEPGSLSARVFPIPIYAQDRNSHGSLDGDTSTHLVGAILKASRRPGPEVTQLTTGQPFPEGTFVWEGEGWIYKDVPPPPAKAAYTLINDGALRGNSVDLSEVEAEFEYDEGQDLASDPRPRRIHLNQGVIAATTLVGQPAFPDAYIELDGVAMEMLDAGSALAASAAGDAVPMWRSIEVGDTCAPCSVDWDAAPAVLVASLEDTFAVSQAKRDKAEEAGHAMPGGRYPIDTEADLDKAIRAVGRAGGPSGTEEDRDAVRRHIIKQAKRLGLSDKIPDTWNSNGTLKASAEIEDFADMMSNPHA